MPPLHGSLPDEIVARFRLVSFERMERMEAIWSALARGGGDPRLEAELHRLVHNLKGDSRVVGFTDVNLLAQKLEDLVFYAGGQAYRVGEDVSFMVMMAFQFIALLLRKKAGQARGGIDLGGFIRQIDDVLQEAALEPGPPETEDVASPHARLELPGDASADRISAPTRHRLAAAATRVYLESLHAPAWSRPRLREVFAGLAREVAQAEALALTPLLTVHAAAGEGLARELGKRTALRLDLGDLRVAGEIADALDVVVLHAVRNAIDHGIESPGARAAAGKATSGNISVGARVDGDFIELQVEDDGAGIDVAAVRARARRAGLPEPANESEVTALLFQRGFTTKDTVGEVSGRGIGLDAIKAAVDEVGGQIRLDSRPGRGTRLTVRVPGSPGQLAVHCFRAPRSPFLLAVPASWQAELEPPTLTGSTTPPALGRGPTGSGVIDVLTRLGVRVDPGATAAKGTGTHALHVLRLVRGPAEVRLWAGSAPSAAIAVRECPTAESYPVEVARVGEAEALLLRPDRLVPVGPLR